MHQRVLVTQILAGFFILLRCFAPIPKPSCSHVTKFNQSFTLSSHWCGASGMNRGECSSSIANIERLYYSTYKRRPSLSSWMQTHGFSPMRNFPTAVFQVLLNLQWEEDPEFFFKGSPVFAHAHNPGLRWKWFYLFAGDRFF